MHRPNITYGWPVYEFYDGRLGIPAHTAIAETGNGQKRPAGIIATNRVLLGLQGALINDKDQGCPKLTFARLHLE